MDRDSFDKLFIKFIEDIKLEYDKVFSTKIKGIYAGSKIRGTNPSLSNFCEDRFADFLSSLFPNKNFLYLIDVSLTTKLDNESKTMRPDIMIVDKSSNSILAIFEVKIDDARAKENWVEIAQHGIERLKQISINHDNNPPENFIRFRTFKLNENGEPSRNNNNRFKFEQHTLTCHPNAMVACFALCKQNSREREGGRMRTEGTNASYISKKHFNNQLYSLEDFLDTGNLFSDEVFQIINNIQIW